MSEVWNISVKSELKSTVTGLKKNSERSKPMLWYFNQSFALKIEKVYFFYLYTAKD